MEYFLLEATTLTREKVLRDLRFSFIDKKYIRP